MITQKLFTESSLVDSKKKLTFKHKEDFKFDLLYNGGLVDEDEYVET